MEADERLQDSDQEATEAQEDALVDEHLEPSAGTVGTVESEEVLPDAVGDPVEAEEVESEQPSAGVAREDAGEDAAVEPVDAQEVESQLPGAGVVREDAGEVEQPTALESSEAEKAELDLSSASVDVVDGDQVLLATTVDTLEAEDVECEPPAKSSEEVQLELPSEFLKSVGDGEDQPALAVEPAKPEEAPATAEEPDMAEETPPVASLEPLEPDEVIVRPAVIAAEPADAEQVRPAAASEPTQAPEDKPDEPTAAVKPTEAEEVAQDEASGADEESEIGDQDILIFNLERQFSSTSSDLTEGGRFELQRGSTKVIRIGRATKNDLIINGPGISWHHVEFKLLPSSSIKKKGADGHKVRGELKLCIRDLSSNGTGLQLPGSELQRLPKGVDASVPDGAVVALPMRLKAQEQQCCFTVHLGDTVPEAGAEPGPEAGAPDARATENVAAGDASMGSTPGEDREPERVDKDAKSSSDAEESIPSKSEHAGKTSTSKKKTPTASKHKKRKRGGKRRRSSSSSDDSSDSREMLRERKRREKSPSDEQYWNLLDEMNKETNASSIGRGGAVTRRQAVPRNRKSARSARDDEEESEAKKMEALADAAVAAAAGRAGREKPAAADPVIEMAGKSMKANTKLETWEAAGAVQMPQATAMRGGAAENNIAAKSYPQERENEADRKSKEKSEEEAEEPEEPPLLCHLPEIEPSGPREDSASAVAARHLIAASGCDSWFNRKPNGDWEEVVRFWPPTADLPIAKRPKIRNPRPDPYGLRELVYRCQKHEEMVRALLSAQHLTDSGFSASRFPTPAESEWCFWTGDGRQLTINAKAAPDPDEMESASVTKPVIKRCPPEGARWRLLRGPLRSNISMLFKAVKLRKLEKLTGRGDKAGVQALLDSMKAGPIAERIPDKLAKAAHSLIAAPPTKQPPVRPPQTVAQPSSGAQTLPGAFELPAKAGPPVFVPPDSSSLSVPTGPTADAAAHAGPLPGVQTLPSVHELPAKAGPPVFMPPDSTALAMPSGPPADMALSAGPLSPPGPLAPLGPLSPPPGTLAPPGPLSPPGPLPGDGSLSFPQGLSGPGPFTAPGPYPTVFAASGAPLLPGAGEALGKASAPDPIGGSAMQLGPDVLPMKAPGPAPMELFGKGSPPTPGALQGTAFAKSGPVAPSLIAEGFLKPKPPPGLPPKAEPPEAFGTSNASASLMGEAFAKGPPEAFGKSSAPASFMGEAFAKATVLSALDGDVVAKASMAEGPHAKGPPPVGLPLGPSPAAPMFTPPGTAVSQGQGTPSTTLQHPPATPVFSTPAFAGQGQDLANIPLAKAAPPPPPPGAPPRTKAPPTWKAPAPAPAATAPAMASEVVSPSQPPAPLPVSDEQRPTTVNQSTYALPAVGREPATGMDPDAVTALDEVSAPKQPAVAPAKSVDAPAEAPWAARKRRRGRVTPAESMPSGTFADAVQGAQSNGQPAEASNPSNQGLAGQPEATSLPASNVVDRTTAERAAAADGPATSVVSGAPQADASDSVLMRKVLVSNTPAPGKASELKEFLTGAVFSATGHTLDAQWQAKVVLSVDISSGLSSSAEVIFGTAMGAAVAVALNGIQFQGKSLDIRRPKGYSGLPVKRAQLRNLTIKDLVLNHEQVVAAQASSAAEASPALPKSGPASPTAEPGAPAAASTTPSTLEAVAKPATATPDMTSGGATSSTARTSGGTKVAVSGVPSSMSEKSVYDLLQQFGGPLHGLQLAGGAEAHEGHGVAEYIDRSSALESVSFSPLLGFIEVELVEESVDTAAAAAREGPAAKQSPSEVSSSAGPASSGDVLADPPPKRPRRTRFDPETSAGKEEDLGPFEAALRQRETDRKPDEDEAVDLGPFESVLPPDRDKIAAEVKQAFDDLGPFEAVLPSQKPAETSEPAMDDLGPFEAVLPSAKKSADLEDLGPFDALLGSRPPAAVGGPSEEGGDSDDDLGPFAAALRGK